jgi:hypothetical protein
MTITKHNKQRRCSVGRPYRAVFDSGPKEMQRCRGSGNKAKEREKRQRTR